MTTSSPISPRDLGLKERRFQSVKELEDAFNLQVRRLNEVYRYNRRDHDRLKQDILNAIEGGDISSITANEGLEGGGDSGDITVGIADGGVTTGKIANATILLEDLAQNGASSGDIMQWNGTAWVLVDLDTVINAAVVALLEVCP